ncbi:MAG: Gfo/Idh/MocA family oxidoreductase [Armatimonadetes bacterium]|nr:Gfo/Idh/MocA family oxidoreductase [Armatimonadota bacterium]
MRNSLGVGIVGYGKVGAVTHRNWINQAADAQLVAVCDATAVRREAARTDNPEANVYDDYAAMLADPQVELVIVTTPPNSHCALACQAAAAGRHVFVDKPFAMTLAEAETMLAAGERAGVVMHCHQSRRYDGEYRAIVETVKAGRIGEIVHLRRVWSQYGIGWATWGIEGFNPTWRVQREYGGGMVYDYAPHCGDQILRLIDQPLSQVFADARGIKFSAEVDDHFSCEMRFANGATAYLEASNMMRLPAPHWYVIGTEGCLVGEQVGGSIKLLAEGMEQPETIEAINDRPALYQNLIAACRGTAEPVVTPAQLRASMGLIDAIFASAAQGQPVAVA